MTARASDSVVQRDARVARVLWLVLVLNLFVAGAKLLVGWQVGALSLVADGLHSVLDGSSNVVGLVGIAIARLPPDRRHPYGHRRFETIAAVVIGLLIGAGFLEVLRELYRGILGQRATPEVSWSAAFVVLLTIVVNVFISHYEAKQGKLLKSALLEADSKHTATDSVAAGAVLLGFGAVALGWSWADLVVTGLVSVFIGYVAWNILRNNLASLADEAQLEPTEVHRVATAVPGVRGAHKIRSRGAADYVHLDLHVHLDPAMSLDAAHALTHQVARALRRQFPQLEDVVIHAEPADGRELDTEHLAPRDAPRNDNDNGSGADTTTEH